MTRWTQRSPVSGSVHSSTIDDIERIVAERDLQPGDRIATMDELRKQSRLGRATISEAARLLTERGTVDVRPGRGGGLFVASAGSVVRLRHTLLAAGQDAVSVANALAVRDSLEELIDTDAARHRTAEDIAELREIVTYIRANGTTREAFMRDNWTLHTRIAAITPNDLARSIYLSTMEQAVGLPTQADAATASDEGDYLAARMDVHEELVEAIASGDITRTSRAVVAHHAITLGTRSGSTSNGG
ncbi:FadR/GntR family transcriptional regulator [Streptomyces sp. NPDC048297]|uniref:FadR/GntR family transcriptional regulator n=1 Tax=Streptomyces sp. NPDC048297 TaxID=3365531 RepID=UPI00371B22A8